VDSLANIKKRVIGVKRTFGEINHEYVTMELQTSLKGLRGELATVTMVGSIRVMDEHPNAYYYVTGKMRIN
jgi:hypothetical protein